MSKKTKETSHKSPIQINMFAMSANLEGLRLICGDDSVSGKVGYEIGRILEAHRHLMYKHKLLIKELEGEKPCETDS